MPAVGIIHGMRVGCWSLVASVRYSAGGVSASFDAMVFMPFVGHYHGCASLHAHHALAAQRYPPARARSSARSPLFPHPWPLDCGGVRLVQSSAFNPPSCVVFRYGRQRHVTHGGAPPFRRSSDHHKPAVVAQAIGVRKRSLCTISCRSFQHQLFSRARSSRARIRCLSCVSCSAVVHTQGAKIRAATAG